MVSKGAVPRTRKEKLTMVQSCNFTLLDPTDFSRRMEKNAYPLVIVYNGRDHYVPTKPTTYANYYQWKKEKELAPILSAGLLVIEEMDLQFLTDAERDACNELEACIVKHLPTLSQKVNAAHHAMAARAPGPGSRGPVFHQVPRKEVPAAPGQPSSSSHTAQPGSTVATDEPAPQPQVPPPGPKRKKQTYTCEHCGKGFSRKPALVGHLWTDHQIGEPIVCHICDKSFSQKSALTKHKKNIHDKKYKYKCPDCWWGSDDNQEYITHRKRHHGKIRRIKDTKEIKRFVCPKCKKHFDGPNLLRRHKRRGTCMDRKKYQCPECLKMYITAKNRDLHIQQHHTPGAKTWVCSKCQKITHSLGASLNHTMWHRGIDILTRARAIRQRKVQTEAMKRTSQHLEKKLPHLIKKKPRKPGVPKVPPHRVPAAQTSATKSAPPKIIPRRTSPRKKPSGTGKK